MRRKLVKCYVSRAAFYGTETWTIRKVDKKYIESFETWCWRRMEISWTDRVKSKEELQTVKEERNTLHIINRKKDNCIGHILCRNRLLK